MPIYALEGVAPEFPADGEYWVAPTAVLIGRVKLMKNASVWFGAVLRGDNDWITIGENSNVQDNSIVHTDPGQPVQVGANVTVGHNVILHSTIVGDNSLIGMGSTLLNRSRIGTNCIVGANTLIPEGKEFADGSLIVGSPGRVVRPLTDAELLRLQMSADIYVANYRRFRDKLVPVG
ncbi:MAG: gamma carbonic anhydrase family protein [Alphaproteobacteria bacterium]|nr:gamma carbonic anhydrase family protein [Alphaproteobacteria bacterium]MDE1985402.1 gamma carbonic anhydrase family protein [Alphaproteobacteria bacterium]MDE2161971.1 gamma carbonic anhydrase family protein [Alphaproteobacteria bacterium]MDE2267104.1 gamma carbonic anhydrase family protein [Alphaproteobacteria bacterium]MDE2499496.1 gamma carbonic anhydrase family protein [Alphaproteobacteria bacterium]